MRQVFFFVLVFFISSKGFCQTLQLLNFIETPVIDTSLYKYEYLEITTEDDGVIHQQLFNRDTVKIRHTTVLLDEQGNKKSERVLGYFPDGEMEFSKRIDYEKDEFRGKYFYPSGALKSDISMSGEEVTSEVYYSETGIGIPKPIVAEASPKGGDEGWYSYLGGAMRYPTQARSAKAEGTVILVFDVDETGTISNIRVGNAEYVHESLWKEAVRVVNLYPHKWIPKTENGIPVRSEVRLPLRFKLG
jgi:TonB family protein